MGCVAGLRQPIRARGGQVAGHLRKDRSGILSHALDQTADAAGHGGVLMHDQWDMVGIITRLHRL
jgi:hypothetical protein